MGMPIYLYFDWDDGYAPIHTVEKTHRTVFRTLGEAKDYAFSRENNGHIVFEIDVDSARVVDCV